MRTARFWWIALGYFCGLFAWYAVQVHQTKYLIECGFAAMYAAWALGFDQFSPDPRQIALGHISDRIGREWVGPWQRRLRARYVRPVLVRVGPAPCCSGSWWRAGLLGYGVTSVVGAIPAEIFAGRHYGSILGP